MQVSIKNIVKHLEEIPEPCNSCLYWEDPTFRKGERATSEEQAEAKAAKASWFLNTYDAFGSCGKLLFVDDMPVGYAQYAPAGRLPNTQEYGSQKLTTAKEDVAFISCLYIPRENFRGKGFGEQLLDHVLADLKTRGFQAVETFARKNSTNNPSGPIELYLKRGFHVVEELGPDFALVRLAF
jgi:ribosomal protein S18 acetylase RimI-like enzyme